MKNKIKQRFENENNWWLEDPDQEGFETYLKLKGILDRKGKKVGCWRFPLGTVSVYHFKGATIKMHCIDKGAQKIVNMEVVR